MKTIIPINIGNRQGHFRNDMTNVNGFDPSLLNIDEVSFKMMNYLCIILSILKI